LRVSAGLTQSELAGDRFSKEYISQIERGKTRPTHETVKWLATRLGVDSSFLESGFWPQEALVVIREPLGPRSKTPVLVVVEGNRRLAALKLLQRARTGQEKSSKWRDFVTGATPEQLDQLTEAPDIEMPARRSVQAYLDPGSGNGLSRGEPICYPPQTSQDEGRQGGLPWQARRPRW